MTGIRASFSAQSLSSATSSSDATHEDSNSMESVGLNVLAVPFAQRKKSVVPPILAKERTYAIEHLSISKLFR